MIQLTENKCEYCGTCVGICPENCIELLESSLMIKHDLCTKCRKCIWVCPVEALYIKEKLDV